MRESARGSNPRLPIGSGRCQCGGCDLYFGSVAGFDKHRRDGRCLTVEQMLERGMVVNEKGYWLTERYDPLAHAAD